MGQLFKYPCQQSPFDISSNLCSSDLSLLLLGATTSGRSKNEDREHEEDGTKETTQSEAKSSPEEGAYNRLP